MLLLFISLFNSQTPESIEYRNKFIHLLKNTNIALDYESKDKINLSIEVLQNIEEKDELRSNKWTTRSHGPHKPRVVPSEKSPGPSSGSGAASPSLRLFGAVTRN